MEHSQQARALAARLAERAAHLPSDVQRLLEQFVYLHRTEISRPARLIGVRRSGIRCQGVARNLYLLLRLLRIPSRYYVSEPPDPAKPSIGDSLAVSSSDRRGTGLREISAADEPSRGETRRVA